MTDRCVHCVFSEIIDKNTCDMKCIKHNKTVKCMDNHCEDIILRPYDLLCYALRYYDLANDWGEASELANNFLNNLKSN